jgi:hypothetical protein
MKSGAIESSNSTKTHAKTNTPNLESHHNKPTHFTFKNLATVFSGDFRSELEPGEEMSLQYLCVWVVAPKICGSPVLS